MNRNRILVVDDEPGVGMIFSKILGEQGYSIDHCIRAEDSFPVIQSQNAPEIIFLDIRLPGMDGVTALPKLLQINPSLRIIIMTAYQTVESVVQAMKMGAVDYLVKPLNPQMIVQAVRKYGSAAKTEMDDFLSADDRRSIDRAAPLSQPSGDAALSADSRTTSSFKSAQEKVQKLEAVEFIGHTPTMKALLSISAQFAVSDGVILILGESGTGKELLAEYIHKKSLRSKKPFVMVDCASIPESLFESELFGYEKGAFTGAESSKAGRFELADGGTLFLDEIGNVPLTLQSKLLRFIEDHTLFRLGGKKPLKLDVRFLAATNLDLKKSIDKGIFREDLYYRLAGLVVHLPPLRNRPEEEREYLVRYFLKKSCQKFNKPELSLSEPVRHLVHNYPWPGNVRELQNVLLSATLLCDSRVLELSHLPIGLQSYFNHRESVSMAFEIQENRTLRETLEIVERERILSVLKQTEGNKKKASEILDMDYKSFLTKLKKYSQEDD